MLYKLLLVPLYDNLKILQNSPQRTLSSYNCIFFTESSKSSNMELSRKDTVASKIIGANQKINKYENIFETNKIKI